MTKKRSRILGIAMLVIAVIFFIVALTHPEMSFTWDISLTYLLYGAYFIVMVIFLIAPFRKE